MFLPPLIASCFLLKTPFVGTRVRKARSLRWASFSTVATLPSWIFLCLMPISFVFFETSLTNYFAASLTRIASARYGPEILSGTHADVAVLRRFAFGVHSMHVAGSGFFAQDLK